MTTDFLVQLVVRLQLAASVAILIVLALRPLARRLLGAELAYALWTLVPVAGVTSLLPSLREDLSIIPRSLLPDIEVGRPALFLGLYLAGAAALLASFVVSEWRFRQLGRQGRVGPAVVGLWPRIVTPSDYHERFSEAERQLIREHERTHIRRNHPHDNRVIAIAQVLGWFNPLVHLAASCARLDQELACDAIVMEAAPTSRRFYAETLLKAQSKAGWSAFACALTTGGRHPLEVRIRLLRRAPLSVRQYVTGCAIVGGLALATAFMLWALAPTTYV